MIGVLATAAAGTAIDVWLKVTGRQTISEWAGLHPFAVCGAVGIGFVHFYSHRLRRLPWTRS